MSDVRDRLTPILEQLPIDVDRSLEAVATRGVRRTRVARFATIGVAVAVAAAGFSGLLLIARLGDGESRPAASQGGTIAYMRAAVDGDEETVMSFVSASDGSDAVRLESGEEWETFPALSPEGTQVAFVGGPGGGGLQDIRASNLYVATQDGSGRRLLVEGGVGSGTISWSPDGKRIAFIRAENREGHWGSLWVVNADGSDAHRVLRGSWDDVAWSPDGTRFALTGQLGFEPCREGICGRPQDTGLHVVDVDGSDLRQLTRPDFVAGEDGDDRWEGVARYPAWSPDSQRIAFVRMRFGGAVDADSHSAIWVIRADESDLEKLTDAPGPDIAPVWSPDGRSVVFSSARHLPELEREDDIVELSLFILDLRTRHTSMLVDGGGTALFATSWVG